MAILILAMSGKTAFAGPCFYYPGIDARIPFVGSISQKLTQEHLTAFQEEWSRQGLGASDPSLVSYHIEDLKLSSGETASAMGHVMRLGGAASSMSDATNMIQNVAAMAESKVELRIICRKSESLEKWDHFTRGTENVANDFYSPAFAEAMESFSRESLGAFSSPKNYLQLLGGHVPFVDSRTLLPLQLNYSFSIAKKGEDGEIRIVDGPSFSVGLGELELAQSLALLSGDMTVIELLEALRRAGKLELNAEKIEAFRNAYAEQLRDPANARVIPKVTLIGDFGFAPLKLATAPIAIQGNRMVPQFDQATLLPTEKSEIELTPLIGSAQPLGEQRSFPSNGAAVSTAISAKAVHAPKGSVTQLSVNAAARNGL